MSRPTQPRKPKISLGRDVHYHSIIGTRAAKVVAANEDGTVILHVFGVGHGETDWKVDGVTEADEYGELECWSWPPRV